MPSAIDRETDNEDGFWVRLWMESGRGHSIVEETYEFFKFSDGYTEEDKKDHEMLSEHAYDWAGNEKGGFDSFDMMRFESGYEVVIVPLSYWLQEELIRLMDKQKLLEEQKNRVKKALGMT
jgi:hypothetical protein